MWHSSHTKMCIRDRAEAKCLSDYEKKTFRGRNTTTTFNQVYETWKEHYRNTVKESTYVSQIDRADRLIIPHFGDKPINKITLSMCQAQVNKWAEEYQRFFGIISIANQIFDYAISMELIDSNPKMCIRDRIKVDKGRSHRNQGNNGKEPLLVFQHGEGCARIL